MEKEGFLILGVVEKSKRIKVKLHRMLREMLNQI